MKTLDAFGYMRHLRREPAAHKGNNGKALLVGGAPTMAGALVLAGRGALYSGAGLTVLMMLDSLSAHLVPEQPELMMHDATQCLALEALRQIEPAVIGIGPGMGSSAHAKQWLSAALQWDGPLIIDADGLNLLSANPHLLAQVKQRVRGTVLTPHPGEAARLLACNTTEIQHDRESAVHALVQATNAVVVLKGHHTLIAAPGHETVKCLQGNPGMAVAGMGDILTGSLTGVVAQGVSDRLSLWDAACLAVELHATAGDQLVQKNGGPIGLTPSEMAPEIRHLMNVELARFN